VTQALDSKTAECLVLTEKEGLLSAAAHDLKIRVERFQIRIDKGSVEAEFDAGSLRVVCARRGGADLPGVLSAKDCAEIEANIAGKILRASAHPSIRFRSSSVKAVEGGTRVEGTLAIRGRERPLAVLVRKEGDRAVAECAIDQPDFGIQPFSAVFGTLRVKPVVKVRLSAPWASLDLKNGYPTQIQ
jgi:hypothetical protein